MSNETNAALSRADFERIWNGVWNEKDGSQTIQENYSDDFQMHIAPLPNPLDRTTFAGFAANWHQAFPDGRMTILDVAITGDRVWCYWVSTGTHSDTYLDIPATGKQVEYRGADVFRVENGRLTECWDIPDVLTLLRQLGAMPG